MAQSIALSPRQILTHLLDVEKKAPRGEFKIYIPSKFQGGSITDDTLVNEARRMLEFAGLVGYNLDICYTTTAEGTAGECANNGADRNVSIHVSEKFRYDWKATVAILAHEICHKVLFVRGLYAPIEKMNEVYAELTTIYYGFGEIILEGYNAKDHCLGYLTPETYKKINLLVCVVCGNIKSDVLNLRDIDPLADKAVEIWEKETEKRSVVIDCFRKTESQISEFYRNIYLTKQVLDKYVNDIKGEYIKWNEKYFKDFLNYQHTHLEYFLFIYDNYVERDFHSDRVAKLNDTVNEVLYNLYSTYQEQGDLELKYEFVCPLCGTVGKNRNGTRGITARKCTNEECRAYITFNTEDWNATVFQRMQDQKQRSEKEKFDKKVDEYVKLIQQGADEQIRVARIKASEKIDEIKRNEQQRAKEEFINKIPSVLRWIVRRYIN